MSGLWPLDGDRVPDADTEMSKAFRTAWICDWQLKNHYQVNKQNVVKKHVSGF